MIMSEKAQATQENTAGTLDAFGIPGVGAGILHPAMAHKFRLVFAPGSEDMKMVTMQVTDVRMNVVKRSMTVYVEQPAMQANKMLMLIERLAAHRHEFRLEFLDGDEGVTGVIGGYAELLDHDLQMSYSMLSHVATHKLVFKYERGVTFA